MRGLAASSRGERDYSFCAPIAVAEALRPAIADRSWLGRRGMTFATALWLAVVPLSFADARQQRRKPRRPRSRRRSP